MGDTTAMQYVQATVKQYLLDHNPTSLPLTFENDAKAPTPIIDFAEVYVSETDNIALSKGAPGNNHWRLVGVLTIVLKGQKDAGSVVLRTYADKFRVLLQGNHIQNVVFGASAAKGAGVAGAFYRLNLRTNWKFDYYG